MVPFNHHLAQAIEGFKRSGKAKHVSVLFRDLENGPTLGLNYEEKFTPASLLKLPMLMAALKYSESVPDFLGRKVRFDVPTRTQSYLTGRTLKPGTEYTVEEVLAALAVHSDNDAFAILRELVPVGLQDEVYRYFGLVIPEVRSIEDSTTVREYASFFRVLYNAAYLNKPNSQKALEMLSRSEYKAGLPAGVPAGVVVSHKYGERFYDSATKQLHDCGIVYHPERPYVLCVMTRGTDFEQLGGVIRDISKMAFDEVARTKNPQ